MASLIHILLPLVILLSHPRAAAEWVVYPASNSDTRRCAGTTRSLIFLLGKDNVHTVSSTIRETTEFWLVQATYEQEAQISRFPFVRPFRTKFPFFFFQVYSRHVQIEAVYENSIAVQDCGRTYGNATAISNTTEPEAAPSNAPFRWQTDASRDLSMISWPPKKPPPEKYRGYVYDIGAGIGTYIYVIDNGINMQNPVSRPRSSRPGAPTL